MLKQAAWTLTELAVFAGLVALVATGCSETRPVVEAAADVTLASDSKAPSEKNAQPVADFALIPRSVLFGNPQRAQARLSPDGEWLSFLAPVDGVLNVWVGPADNPDAAVAVTEDKVRGIRSHGWAYNSEYIVYTQDKAGDENWHVYATNVENKKTTDLTPIEGVNAQLSGASEKFPDQILVGLNDREARFHDLWRVNVTTGKRVLLQENPGVAGFVTDDDFKVRMAVNFTPDAGQVWLQPEGELSSSGYEDWEAMEKFSAEDAMTSGPAGFDKTGRILYFEDSRDRNTAGLFSRNLDSGNVELIAEDPRADVGGVLAHPTEKNLQAVSFTYSRREWKILDEAIRGDVEFLTEYGEQKLGGGEWQVTSRTLDDSLWTVAYILDNGPLKFYVYHRPDTPQDKPGMRFLFNSRDDLEGYPLVKMHTPVIKSRDGLNLVSYLTLPPGADPDGDGVPDEAVPMVLDVHGGPWARDGWGFNASHQWLANRGYAVLSVNYRGSTGFGKEFINAANGEWAGKMHDDLLDAVEWAVDRGVAQRDKVAIMGGSYGGYATLVGMTFTPQTFACGVDIVGPSSLVTLLENVPPYWFQFMPVMKLRVGDWETEEGQKGLLAKSPLTLVDKIERPLLIGQGANDPRVTQLEADQIVEAMNDKGIPVTYVLYPDEGHGFRRPENSKSFNAVTEAFLAEHLGGRFEPIGEDFQGSTIHVPTGAAGVPGLEDALPEDRQQMPAEEAAEEAA